jgi:hypothetical protein
MLRVASIAQARVFHVAKVGITTTYSTVHSSCEEATGAEIITMMVDRPVHEATAHTGQSCSGRWLRVKDIPTILLSLTSVLPVNDL